MCYVSGGSLRREHGTTSCGCNRTGLIKAQEINIAHDTNIGNINSEKLLPQNKTGVRGVCYGKRAQAYIAYISFQKRRYTLKISKNFDECVKARKEAEEHINGEFLKWYENQKGEDKK